MSHPIPKSMREMTPEWLTDALGPDVVGDSRVIANTTVSLSEGVGFIGEVARIELSYDDRADHAPRSVIAKIPIDEPGGRALGNMLRLYERESTFYASMAEHLRIRVPRCLHNSADVEAGDFCLLLEDLGHLQPLNQRSGADLDQARSILQTIATFHGRWDGESGAVYDWLPRPNDAMLVAFSDQYDEARAKLQASMGDKVDPRLDETTARLAPHRLKIMDSVAQIPASVNHGDFRLDNMFFDDGELVLFDWQGLSRGTPIYDVVYFLATNVHADVLAAEHESLFATWQETYVEAGGRPMSMDEMMTTAQQVWAMLSIFGTVLLGELDFSSQQGTALFDAIYPRAVTAGDVFDLHGYRP